MSLCDSCYPQLGLGNPLTGTCQSARTFERLRCVPTGVGTVPGTYVRRSRIGVYFYGVSAGIPPSPGGNLDISGSLAAPAGCGSPVDDLICVGGVKALISGTNAATIQFQATFDYAFQVGAAPTLPSFPVTLFDTRPAGQWLYMDYLDRTAVIPAGQTGFFAQRVTRGPAGPNWQFVDLGEFMFHHYANVS